MALFCDREGSTHAAYQLTCQVLIYI